MTSRPVFLSAFLCLAACLLAGPLAKDATAQTAKKLDYKQQKELKDAQGYLDQVESELAKLTEAVTKATGGEAVFTTEYAYVEGAIKNAASTKQRLINVKNRTDKLPADHAEVATAIERHTKYATELAALEAKLVSVKTELDAVRDPARYPNFDRDLAKVEALAQQFGRTSMLRDRPEEAVETIAQWPEVGTFINTCIATYRPVILQETAQGTTLLAKLKHFKAQHLEFIQAVFKFLDEGARDADQAIDGAVAMADEAVKDKKPAFFAGGVAQKLDQARARTDVLAALVAPAALALLKDKTKNNDKAAPFLDECAKTTATLVAKLEQAKARVAKQATALEGDIVRANVVPPSGYAGADAADLIAKAKERWMADHSADEIKAAVIAAADWKRSDTWKWNGATKEWVHYDTSTISVLLAVKTDDTTATLFLVWIAKDHLAGDALRVSPEPREPQPPQRRLLLANIK